MSDTPEQRLGNACRTLRRQQGITQEDLADRSGLHVTYIAGIETGRRNPSLKSLIALAKGFGVPVSELMRVMEQ